MNKKQIISSRQIKAARALLDWSQEYLAEASGLSVATIRKIESGHTSPRGKTNEQLTSAFEKAGLEFIEYGGVRNKPNIISTIEGENAYLHLLDDVFHTLKDTNGELLIWYADNKISPKAVIESQIRLRKNGIRFRYLVEEGNTYMHFPLNEYSWVPHEYFINNVIQIYGNKVGMNLHTSHNLAEPVKSILIIESDALAEAMRNAFNFMWENSRKPTHSTAPELFD